MAHIVDGNGDDQDSALDEILPVDGHIHHNQGRVHNLQQENAEKCAQDTAQSAGHGGAADDRGRDSGGFRALGQLRGGNIEACERKDTGQC